MPLNAGMQRPFVPRRLRSISRERRAYMFSEGGRDQLEQWCAREWQRCERPTLEGLVYFTQQYGSIEPPVGEPIPFYLWPAQKQVLQAFLEHEVSCVLKARRLGLSWLALHFAAWILLFEPYGPGSRIVLICKNDDDAKKLLSRVRRIYERLPFWLRPTLEPDNVRELGVESSGSSIMALPATDRAARQETATLFILDEFAFPKDGAAHGIWTSVLPTIEGGGRGIVISTGNGRMGDGATFATIWERASAGTSSINPIFLPWTARPDRTIAWYESKRSDYIRVEDFLAEYPATADEALQGQLDPGVYPWTGIQAAVEIGHILDDYFRISIMDGVEVGGDWGDFQTNALYACALAAGGVWVCDELVQLRVEPVRASQAILEHEVAGLAPGIQSTAFDAMPRGTNATFASVLRSYHEDQPDSYPRVHLTWPFGTIKEGGKELRGINTVAYIELMFTNAARLWDRIRPGLSGDLDDYGRLSLILSTPQLIAISPRCEVLAHQLRELRRGEDGRIAKPTPSPSDPLAGDHGPDALIALCAGRATSFTATLETARSRE